jgi:hypothetical protein
VDPGICSRFVTDTFDDAAIERLRLAAEEVAWLSGRGYAVDRVSDFVAAHHALGDAQRAALAKGTCSEPQYRRRAARELEAEDVARRPLAIDAVEVIATIEAALEGRPVLQTLDGTVRAFGIDRASYAPGPRVDEAIDTVLRAAKELRPSALRFVGQHAELGARITARAKELKAKIEIVDAPESALRKEKQIVSGDADVLDACAGWVNLVGFIVEGMKGARVVRLQ